MVILSLVPKSSRLGKWYLLHTQTTLENRANSKISSSQKTILFCCSSVGEYLSIKPIITKLHHSHQCIVSAFSPSLLLASEAVVSKDQSIIPSPLDKRNKVNELLNEIKPDYIILSANELWPVFLSVILERRIPYSFVGLTIDGQSFFRRCLLKFFKPILQNADSIYTHSESTILSLQELNIRNRVHKIPPPRVEDIITHTDHSQNDIEAYIKNSTRLFVFASIHRSDLSIIIQMLPALLGKGYDILIVPHEPSDQMISNLKKQIPYETNLNSVDKSWSSDRINIYDKIGYLKQIYYHADYAYIGGGFDRGVHNLLEAVIAETPIVFGPKHHKFPEAQIIIDNNYGICLHDPIVPKEVISRLRTLNSNRQKFLQLIGYDQSNWIEDLIGRINSI